MTCKKGGGTYMHVVGIKFIKNGLNGIILTSCVPPAGVPVVGTISAQTGSDGLTKHYTA